ncbi:MAG: carboxypeptidase-like regulatory domain-containing protein [Desulfuromonadaceae bacterium]|nr:carboxypeptidase-like regulatory domain-containing protein [Desulfuromonadaceae bacterium]
MKTIIRKNVIFSSLLVVAILASVILTSCGGGSGNEPQVATQASALTASNFSLSAPDSQQAAVGNNIINPNLAGVEVPTFSLSGTLTSEKGGFSGVTVKLSGAGSAEVTTDNYGNFTFIGLANGNYIITPEADGYEFIPASKQLTVNGLNAVDVNFDSICLVP